MFGFGGLCGMRGNSEHALLTFDQIANGKFPKSHPLYPGKEWWGLGTFGTDKTWVLDLLKGHVRPAEDGTF